mmetsp:Transcript_22362/g.25150  ORF Transcript_22362/g.25150 Transcript_22362/m.25150 type:complete len:726 (+) Transcript_22362:124-2301(+)
MKTMSPSSRKLIPFTSSFHYDMLSILFYFLTCLSIDRHHSAMFVDGFIPHVASSTTGGFLYQSSSSSSYPIIMTPLLSMSLSLSSSSENNENNDGEVGKGSNWLEKSFPVDTDAKISTKNIDDYNIGISGKDFQTGPLSKRMFNTIISRTSIEMSDEIKDAFTLYAMDFTAKEATRAALKENGLDMVLQEEEEDAGMWADLEAIRLYDIGTENPTTKIYDSLEDAIVDWTPGQTFDFVARQVPAKMKELNMDELVQALDPDGTLRKEAKELRRDGDDDEEEEEVPLDEEALLSIFDDEYISTLEELASDNMRRTESAPRGSTDAINAFSGSDSSKGYRVINRSSLLRDSINQDGTENEMTLIHVMNALVSHGVLIVDLTDGGSSFKDAEVMSRMWKATNMFFEKVSDPAVASKLPGMTTAKETGSSHAKVGYGEYDSGSMKFLETRRERQNGNLLPEEAKEVLGEDGTSALQSSFDIVAEVGKDVVRIVVAASSVEHGAFLDKKGVQGGMDQKILASQGATLLSCELVDDGKPLSSDVQIVHDEGTVSMSPYRLCRYTDCREGVGTSREVFGAHTDSSFVTAVPVAEISGLEVYDEEAEKWYRPELRARAYWEEKQSASGKDPSLQYDELSDGKRIPWHSRYLIIIPGENLQLAARNEVPATVHRVVAMKDRPARLSAPILIRGRPGTKFLTKRYLGGALGNSLLLDADELSMEEIHEKSQPAFQ